MLKSKFKCKSESDLESESDDNSSSYETEEDISESIFSLDEEQKEEENELDAKKKIIYDELDKEILEYIRKEEKDRLFKELIDKGLVKTCTGCGRFTEKFMYRTRKCKLCFRDYTNNKYTERKRKMFSLLDIHG